MRRVSAVPPVLFCLSVVIALTLTVAARAQEKEPEVVLPGCGILYPRGYDPNTVGVVAGRVAAFDSPEHGPVSFRVDSGGETYTVFTAPAWYWEEQQLNVRNGDEVHVKGSKTMGADGNLYLVAQQITVAGAKAPVVLRDARGKPAWSGCGPEGCGRLGRRPSTTGAP